MVNGSRFLSEGHIELAHLGVGICQFEVRAEGIEVCACQRPVQLILFAHEQDARGFHRPIDGGVGALEAHVTVFAGHVTVTVVDGHTYEYRVYEVVGLVPLDNERRAGRDCGRRIDEVQRQLVAFELGFLSFEHHGLHVVAIEGAFLDRKVEGQHEGVPVAVLVECAAGERHFGHAAVPFADSAAVVGIVGKSDGLKWTERLAVELGLEVTAAADGAGEYLAAVIEGLALGDGDFAVDYAGGGDGAGAGEGRDGDTVVGVGPTEGDGAAGADAGGGAVGGEVAAAEGDFTGDAVFAAGGSDHHRKLSQSDPGAIPAQTGRA